MSISIGALGMSTYNRLSGIESGLDTESLIKGLTSAEENRVIKAAREKQLLSWKREFYSEIIQKLNSFNSKYLTAGSNALEGMFSKYTAHNTGSQYVTVSPGTNASQSSIVIRDIVSLATASRLESANPVSKPTAITVDLEKTGELSGKSMNISLDGNQKTITFSAGAYSTVDDVRQELQVQLDNAFGAGRISVGVTEDGSALALNSPGNTIVLGKSDDTENDASTILGFTDGESNIIKLSDKISELSLKISPGSSGTFKINGVEFSFGATTTLRDIMSTINSSNAGVTMSYSSLTDSFTMTSKNTGTGNQISIEDVSGTFMESVFGTGMFTDGTNAEIRINTNPASSDPEALTYTTVVKSSNTFEIDGITYSLIGKADGTADENIRINVSYDADSVASSIKQFVADYNDLLKSITDKLSETTYKDFPPLTDEQRKELGETQAALYDQKAKSGLLRNDSYLSSIATSLRNAMNAQIAELSDNSIGIGTTLADIGVTTGLYSEKGQLKIDETRLRKALSEKPGQIVKLFTQKSSVSYSPYVTDETLRAKRGKESGLMYRISDIIQGNIRTTTGSLTKLVGNSENNYSSIYALKLRELDKKIALFQERLKEKQNYYWIKFSKMESSLSSLNKQSAYLFQLSTSQ